jgi:hypothetical protein
MFNTNNHIFKLNNKPLKNYPYPFQLSYCPIKSCCNDEYAKLNANNVFSKINTFNEKVVINSGNLQIKDLKAFPPTSPGFGNFASINGNPYYYDYITNNWINLLENKNINTFSLISDYGIYDNIQGTTTWTLEMSNIYGQLFDYQATTVQSPKVINFSSANDNYVELTSSSGHISAWGVSTGCAIFVPYTVDGQPGNGAYVFTAYNHPGFGNFTGLQTPPTNAITGSNLYTTVVDGNYSNRQFVLNLTIRIPFIN